MLENLTLSSFHENVKKLLVGYLDHRTTNDPETINNSSLSFDPRPIDFMEGNGVNRSGYWVPVMYNHGSDSQIGSQAAQADDFPMSMGFNQIYYVKGNALSDAAWEASIHIWTPRLLQAKFSKIMSST